MLLGNADRLDERIVLALSKKDSASAAWLHTHTGSGDRSYTLQAVYKELRKLQRNGVVVKHGDQFSLNLTWILGQIEIVDRMYKTHILGGLAETVFPAEGERASWRFTSLSRLDDFLMHVVLALLECSKSKVMYQWIPHPWIRMLQAEKSRAFREAVRNSKFNIHVIMRKRVSALEIAEALTESDIYDYSFSAGPFRGENNRFYYSVDDYLLTLSLDKKTFQLFEHLYLSERSMEHFYTEAALDLLKTPVGISAKLELGTRAAHKIKKRFEDKIGQLD